MTKEITVEFYPFDETSSNYTPDKDVMNAFLSATREYVRESATSGRALTLSGLLNNLDIPTDNNVANYFVVKDLVWFDCYEGWFVGAFLERSL